MRVQQQRSLFLQFLAQLLNLLLLGNQLGAKLGDLFAFPGGWRLILLSDHQ